MHYTTAQRIFALKCLWNNPGDIHKAVAQLRKEWPEEWGRVPPHPREFMERQQANIDRDGTFDDAPRSGAKLKLDADTCEVAAGLFMKGHYVPTENPQVLEWHGFSSIADAIDHEPALEQIRERCKVARRTLFNRILSAHPEIRKYTRDYKRKKTPQQRKERQETAKVWLRNFRANPRRWLQRQVYFDEGTIDLEDAKDYTMREYVVEGDERLQTVLTMPLPKGGKNIRLCFYIAVSPLHGGICIYLTTGTTQLVRRYVDPRITSLPLGKFKVRVYNAAGGTAWIQMLFSASWWV